MTYMSYAQSFQKSLIKEYTPNQNDNVYMILTHIFLDSGLLEALAGSL